VNQINVHSPEPVDTVDASGDRTAAAGINLITVLVVLAVLAVIAWYLFTGPLRIGANSGTTNINVNVPATTVPANPPGQSNPPVNPNPPANQNPGNTNPAPTKP
jgi:hypothetical protein